MGGRCGDACDMSKVIEDSWRGRENYSMYVPVLSCPWDWRRAEVDFDSPSVCAVFFRALPVSIMTLCRIISHTHTHLFLTTAPK